MIFNIYSKNNSANELEVVSVLKSVCKNYNMPVFTNEIAVEEGVVPHAYPILTINTRVKEPRLLLKTLVHEQFHWYTKEHPQYAGCIAYLKKNYKNDGEHNKSCTYPNSYWEHIIVCYNTRNYLESKLSQKDILWIYEQWQPYPELEKLIVQKKEVIKKELEKFGILFHL